MILKEKLAQAPAILEEKGVDLWLTFARETSSSPDPALDLILGTTVTWHSAFIVTPKSPPIAIVGSLDKANIESQGLYTEIIPYVAGIKDSLLETLGRFEPEKIAINYSADDVMSDGLSHGMYLVLTGLLEKTPYADRLVSSSGIIAALRGRKSESEIANITRAIEITEEIFNEVSGFLRSGRTEKEVASFIREQMEKRGLEAAWDPDSCPAVFTGPESAGAHAGPTDRPMEPGHIMNIDFGVKYEGYCSDLQRTWYFLRPGEKEAPAEVVKGLETIRDAIKKSGEALKAGKTGLEIDTVARSHITDAGYEEYPHALGHQVGRSAHDGAGILCPEWERYGKLPHVKVEAGQVYTLEPRLTVKGHGVATLEEIVVVTDEGCKYLSHPQTELWLVSS